MSLLVLIIVAAAIGMIAAAMTWFNTYNEYQHHMKGHKLFKESFSSGLVSFVFFFVITLVIAFIIYRLFK